VTSVCLSPNGLEKWSVEQPAEALLAATADGVVRLEQGAASRRWQVVSCALRGLHISSLLREPRSGVLFAGVHGEGLYRSFDDGSTWSAAMVGLRHPHVFCLACVEGPSGVTVYAGCEPAHLYRSRDLGGTWEELPAMRRVDGHDKWSFPAPPHLAHVKHIAFDPRDSHRMFVCIEQGALLRSDDGGQSFRELQFQDRTFRRNNDAHRIVFNPRQPAEVCLVNGEGVSRSHDGGETWERLTTPAMRISYPDGCCYSPEEHGVLFVAGSGSTPDEWRRTGDAAGALACSRDNGCTWSQVRGGLPRRLAGNVEAVSLVVWPRGFGFFAGTTDGDIFHSHDKGRNWSRIAAGLPPMSKCVHHRNLADGRARAVQVRMAGLQSTTF
jgi:photosystem II stability/assembly factor-like uncharacterized protein